MGMTSVPRFLLLVLPLIVGAVLYIEGQNYDPGLLILTDNTGQAGVILPKSLGDFRLTGEVRIFTKENLYEYINGHAEFFIGAGFEGLSLFDYYLSGNNSDQPDVVVEVYNMGKNIQAFGVLSDELGGEVSYLENGSPGRENDNGAIFSRGKYYIKLTAFSRELPLKNLTDAIAEFIPEGASLISPFSVFTVPGEVVNRRFIKEGYRGLDFFNNVHELEYLLGNKKFFLSIVTDTSEGIEDLKKKFFVFFENDGIEYNRMTTKDKTLSIFKISDPYEGDWYIAVGEERLAGIFGDVDSGLIGDLRLTIDD